MKKSSILDLDAIIDHNYVEQETDQVSNELMSVVSSSIVVVGKTARDYTRTHSQVEAMAKYGTKSDAIRGLSKEGFKTSEIANIMNIRYQHVRNVLAYVLKTK